MARSRSAKQSFSDLACSAPTLVPLVLGLGAAIIIWAVRDKEMNLAIFLAVAGALGGLGTLLTLWIAQGDSVPQVVVKGRQQLLASLDAVVEASVGAATEADLAPLAAQLEKY